MKRSFDSPARHLAITLALGAFIASPLPASAQTTGAATGKTMDAPGSIKSTAASDISQDGMRNLMMDNMKKMESMPTTGDTDRDFAQMMKMHHQGAIEMAQMELKNGKDAKLRAMARRIIAAQQKEIKEFDQWLAARKGKK